MAVWGLLSAGLAVASLVVAPKAKQETMRKELDKLLAERESAKQQETDNAEKEED